MAAQKAGAADLSGFCEYIEFLEEWRTQLENYCCALEDIIDNNKFLIPPAIRPHFYPAWVKHGRKPEPRSRQTSGAESGGSVGSNPLGNDSGSPGGLTSSSTQLLSQEDGSGMDNESGTD